MTAIARRPDGAGSGAPAEGRERELLDRIAELEAQLAARERLLDEYDAGIEQMERSLAVEREVTDRALRRRYWWW